MAANLETKAQEIEHLQQFVAELPETSYLAAIFAEAVPMIAEAIRNDFCTIPLRQLFADKAREQQELTTLRIEKAKEIAGRDAEVKSLERRAKQALADLAEVQALAQRLAAIK